MFGCNALSASPNASPSKGAQGLTGYPRFVTPSSSPFEPVLLAEATEMVVCRGDKRRYTDFYCVGVYGGIATGYACGCCLRCVFCWVGWSRDFPEKHGKLYSPEESFDELSKIAQKRGVRKLRVSGAEPTIGKSHLLKLLEFVEGSSFELFILETNGILFGADEDYVSKVAKFNKVHVRVSLKAGTPEAFAKKTGAMPESFSLPFKALERLIRHGASFHVAAMIADPRIVSVEERASLLKRLKELDPRLPQNLEEEVVDPYPTAISRLKYAGYELEWPLKGIYAPICKG